jgi:hypothetical membrane protein
MSVPVKLKLHSLVILGVAAAFQWFFMFTKHNPDLRPIIPFGDDPYDALGSFATIVNIVLCLLLLWRSFRPMRGQSPSPAQTQYLRRTQAAIPLSIVVTLAADAIAMARHPHQWLGTPGQNKLLAVFAAMLAISVATLLMLRSYASASAAPQQRERTAFSLLIVAALFVVVLAIYPEHLINRLSTHVLTVLLGDLLLFVPVAAFLRFLFPDLQGVPHAQSKSRGAARYVWIGAVLISLAIGVWLFIAELTEGGAAMPPMRMRLFVASFYIGLTLAGTLIALALLSRLLGLSQATDAQPNA